LSPHRIRTERNDAGIEAQASCGARPRARADVTEIGGGNGIGHASGPFLGKPRSMR
jgi:hypothetical protein